MSEEELEKEEQEELVDDGKIHFPISGIIVIGVIVVLMVVCITSILVFRGK